MNANCKQCYLPRHKCICRPDADADYEKAPKALEQIADVVLNYRPKSKVKKPRKRKKARRRA